MTTQTSDSTALDNFPKTQTGDPAPPDNNVEETVAPSELRLEELPAKVLELSKLVEQIAATNKAQDAQIATLEAAHEQEKEQIRADYERQVKGLTALHDMDEKRVVKGDRISKVLLIMIPFAILVADARIEDGEFHFRLKEVPMWMAAPLVAGVMAVVLDKGDVQNVRSLARSFGVGLGESRKD